MGQRKRRKRRREFRKPDAVIVILGSLTIVLLLVWGGLYWKETSERTQIVHAGGKKQFEQAMHDDIGLQTADSETFYSEGYDQPAIGGETLEPAARADDESAINDEAQKLPQASGAAQETVAQPGKRHPVKSNSHGAAETDKPSAIESGSPSGTGTDLPSAAESEMPSKTGTQLSNEMETESSTEMETEWPSAAETGKPNAAETGSPIANPIDPPISQKQKYEQEITQVQAMCTKEMKEALGGAESSFQQLDKKDPFAFQAWNENLTKELAAAETKCDGKFQEITVNAEKDSISPTAIEEWRQTFNALKVTLQGESKAKLQQWTGG
ncbi:hypothetical protein [Cohnella herbarum]|uniref:Uncharacterized protein n=1 Tax=Cohnella herbarum TaxID=2728023 RepID=A0A7Z2VQT7_9BACL|nr:hypothetical protein [Cohnella herbarum]QJD87445.1 hypothetical protein HH215_32560 [Cohnella herbarum]